MAGKKIYDAENLRRGDLLVFQESKGQHQLGDLFKFDKILPNNEDIIRVLNTRTGVWCSFYITRFRDSRSPLGPIMVMENCIFDDT